METTKESRKSNGSKTHRVLTIAVIFLALGLVGQSLYVVKLKNDQKSPINQIEKAMLGSPGSLFSGALEDDFSSFEPFREMERIQEKINRMFHDSFRRGSLFEGIASPGQAGRFFEPTADIQDKGEFYLVKLDLPGMEKDRINIEVTGNALTVSGERNVEEEKTDKKHGYYRMERSFGQFQRMIPLPADVQTDKVEADYNKGVLAIKLPKITGKAEREPSKSVSIA